MAEPATTTTTTGATAPKKDTKPAHLLVLDSTATEGPRTHEQIVDKIVTPYTFERGKPLRLPYAVAAKFLQHDAFKCVNEEGKIIAWQRRPRQPEELGAGERLKLADNETIARYDELSSAALFQRAVELPGGERFAKAGQRPERTDMIAFITEAAVLKKKANVSNEKDIGEGEFVPEAEAEEDAA